MMNTSDQLRWFISAMDIERSVPLKKNKQIRTHKLKIVLIRGCGKSQPVHIETEEATVLAKIAHPIDKTILV